MAIAAIGAAYIILMAPILLPERQGLETEINASGYQYIAQIRVTPNHPLVNAKPIAGLFPTLKDVTVRMVQRGERSMLPPFEETLEPGDILVVAATRKSLSNLLSSQPEYLRGMLTIGGFEAETDAAQPLIISEAVIAPGSRMIGRTIEQVGFRRQTGMFEYSTSRARFGHANFLADRGGVCDGPVSRTNRRCGLYR